MENPLAGLEIDWLNLIALIWFVICFKGYKRFAIIKSRTTPCLANMLHLYRVDWMRRMLERDVRVADTAVIANLERSVAFFASTSMLIMAGLLTLLGSSDTAIDIFAEIPFVTPSSKLEWELKIILLIIILTYAFFKFTWSLRLYGFCSVLVGSAPRFDEGCPETELNAFIKRASKMIFIAANTFNFGLRSYYFSLAVVGWFINPWIFMVLSAGVVYVLYQREFNSAALKELVESVPYESSRLSS